MNIGRPMREIEIEPVTVPVPELAPSPELEPEAQPDPESVPDAMPAMPPAERRR